VTKTNLIALMIALMRMVLLDWTKEASQRGMSVIVIKTAPGCTCVVKLDLWHPGSAIANQ
jgi:hypothetical protein